MDWPILNILLISLILGSHLLVSGYVVGKEDLDVIKDIAEAEKKENTREKKSINVDANIFDEVEDETAAIKDVLAGIKDLAEVEKTKSKRMKKSYKDTAADEAMYDEDGNIILINNEVDDYNDYFDEEASEIEQNPLTPVTAEHQHNVAMLNEIAGLISSEGKKGCKVEDSTKEEGESWMDNCNTCTCMKGQPVCTTRECPQLLGSASVAAVITEAAPVGPEMAAASGVAVAAQSVATSPALAARVPALAAAAQAVAASPAFAVLAAAVAAAPGVSVAAPRVTTSPALAVLAPAVAAVPGVEAAAPVVVTTPAEAEAALVSTMAAAPEVVLAPEVAAAAPAVATSPALGALVPSVAAAPAVVAAAQVVPGGPNVALALPDVAAASPVATTSTTTAAVYAAATAAEATTTLPTSIAPESNTDTYLDIAEAEIKENAREKRSIIVDANIFDEAEDEKTAIRNVLAGIKDLSEVEETKNNRRKKSYKETAADDATYDEDGNILLKNDYIDDYSDYSDEEVSEIEQNSLTPVTAEHQQNVAMLNELSAFIKKGCKVKDSMKDEGETWMENCNTCTCTKSQPVCTTRECPQIKEIEQNPLTPVTAEHQQNVAMLNELAAFIKKGCKIKDSMKDEGESWMENCNTCTCMKGQPVCTTRECPQIIGSAPVGAVASAMASLPPVPAVVEAPALAVALGEAVAAPSVATSPALAALAPGMGATPGFRAAPGMGAPPGMEAAPGMGAAPGIEAAAPLLVAIPNVTAAPNMAEALPVVAAASSVVEAVPALALSSSLLSSPVAATATTTAAVEAAATAAEATTTVPTTDAFESNTDTSLAMSNTTSEPTIQTPCLEWGVSETNQEYCMLPWTLIGEDCLLLSSNHNLSTLIDSRNSCKKIHAEADLAIPTNLTLIKEYLLKKGSPLVNRTLWVGGSDLCTPGELQWLDGSPINSSIWLEGEPLLTNNGNDCVVVDVYNTKLLTKTCTEQHKFICQKSAKKILRATNSSPTIQSPCYNWGVNKTNQEECKLPWTMIGSDCLLLSSNQNVSTLNDSRHFCKKINPEADLAIPADFKLIKDYLLKKESPLVNLILWVGGSDLCEPGEPRWLNGSAINSNLWLNGKPTLNNKGNECVVLDVKNDNLLTKNCTEQYKFICEKSAKTIK